MVKKKTKTTINWTELNWSELLTVIEFDEKWRTMNDRERDTEDPDTKDTN